MRHVVTENLKKEVSMRTNNDPQIPANPVPTDHPLIPFSPNFEDAICKKVSSPNPDIKLAKIIPMYILLNAINHIATKLAMIKQVTLLLCEILLWISIGAKNFKINAGKMFNNRINDFGVFLDVKSMARDKIMTYRELLTNPSMTNLLYVERSIVVVMFVWLCASPKMCFLVFICYNLSFFLNSRKVKF